MTPVWGDEVRNARIGSTFLGVEDHGIFTWNLDLEYGGSGQGFCGPCLDESKGYDDQHVWLGRRGTAFGHECIRRLLEKLRVDSWEKLRGLPVKVKCERGMAMAIAPFLAEDDRPEDWFDARVVAAEFGL